MSTCRRHLLEVSSAALAALLALGGCGPVGEPENAELDAEGYFTELPAEAGLHFVHFNGMSGAR